MKKETAPVSKKSGRSYSVNTYYLMLSRRFRLAKFLAILAFAVYVGAMLAAYRKDITVENFQYLLRYLNTGSDIYSYSLNGKKISYSADTETAFGSFRGDFVTADSTSLNIYSVSGSNILSESSYIASPVIKSSQKHLLVYDLGGNTYAIFNTFSKLFDQTLPYPITGAVCSDSGIYAIVTKTEQYRSAVYVYDGNFNLKSKILKDKLVTDVDIKSDGSSVLVASAYVEGGDFCTELMACPPQSDTAAFTLTLDDIMPIYARYQSDGFAVVCDSKLLFYTDKGEKKSEYGYRGEIPSYALITADYTFLAFPENIVGDSYRLLVFDTEGKQTAQSSITGQIIRIQCSGNQIYILTSDSIIRRSLGSVGATAKLDIGENGVDLVMTDKNTLFICFQSYALALDEQAAFAEGGGLAKTTRPQTEPETSVSEETPEALWTAPPDGG